MLGPAKPRRLDEPIAVSLEDLVPADHFYRHLEAKLDLGFVRDWTRELYAERGPALASTRSSSSSCSWSCSSRASAPSGKLIETASLNLAHRWYLGYALDEDAARPLQPDPHPAAPGRRRLPALLRAGRRSVPGGRARLGAGALLRRHEGRGQRRHPVAHPPLLLRRHDARGRPVRGRGRRRCTARRYRPACQASCRCRSIPRACLPRAIRRGGCWRSGGSIRTVPPTAATGAPATSGSAPPIPMPPRCGTGAPSASATTTTTSSTAGKRRIILAALVTPADVMESQAMRDLLWRVCFRRKIWPHHVTGDAKYGTIENIVAIEDAGIRAYVPLTDFAHRTDFYGQDDFVFDPERDEYRCPQGHPLRRYARQAHRGSGGLPRRRGHLQRLSGQGPVHHQRPRPQGPALVLRRLPGEGAGLPRDRGRTRRRSASARSGSSRSSPRPRSGTAYAGSACGACSTPTSRGC